MIDLFQGSPTTHLVASEILRHGPLHRKAIAARNHISEGTVSRISYDLIHLGLITETNSLDAPAVAERGRPTVNLAIRPEAATFIGINLTGTQAHGLLTNAINQPIGPLRVLELDDKSPSGVAATVARLADLCIADLAAVTAPAPAPTMLGVSIGGHVVGGATVTSAPFLGWNDPVDFSALVEEASGLPSLISNDLEALLLFEQWFGAGKGLSQFALLTLGAGIGFGLVNNDAPVTHPDNTFGLVGHILIDPEGPPCVLGSRHRGCSQCLTDDSLADEYSKAIGGVRTFDEYAADVAKGVPQARQLVARECFRIGVLIGIIANFTMPQKVLVAGESAFLAKNQVESIREGIREYRPSQASAVPFEILDSERDHWALGAAAVALTGLVNGSLSV